MGLRVNQNIMALTAHRNLQVTDWQLAKSIERLSSGLRINRTSDDPAGYVQSELMRTQIKGTEQAITNLTDAISMVQTMEAAYDEIEALIRNIRTLALHAANTGPNDAAAIQADQDQINNAIASLEEIATTRKYGTKVLLNGDLGARGYTNLASVSFVNIGPRTSTFEVGYEGITTVGLQAIFSVATATRIVATMTTAHVANLGADETVTINGVNILLSAGFTPADTVNTINYYQDRTGVVATQAAGVITLTHKNYGSAWRIDATSDRIVSASGIGGAKTITNGVDVAGRYELNLNGNTATFAAKGYGRLLVALGETQTYTISGQEKRVSLEGLTIQGPASAAAGITSVSIYIANNFARFQIGPHYGEDAKISIQNARPSMLGITQKLSDIDVRSYQGAQAAIKSAEESLSQILAMRSSIGAFQKQFLESTKGNLMVYRENLAAAESNIRDTDMAQEMISFTRHQILMQSGTAMLAQANLAPQAVLQLLR